MKEMVIGAPGFTEMTFEETVAVNGGSNPIVQGVILIGAGICTIAAGAAQCAAGDPNGGYWIAVGIGGVVAGIDTLLGGFDLSSPGMGGSGTHHGNDWP